MASSFFNRFGKHLTPAYSCIPETPVPLASSTFVSPDTMHGFYKLLALMATTTALVQAGPVKPRAGGVSIGILYVVERAVLTRHRLTESWYELAQPVCQPVRRFPQERGRRDRLINRGTYQAEMFYLTGPYMVFQLGPYRSKWSWRIRCDRERRLALWQRYPSTNTYCDLDSRQPTSGQSCASCPGRRHRSWIQ
jgi:hypothetical protein